MENKITEAPLPYQSAGLPCHGYLYSPSVRHPSLPGIVVFHAWRGQDAFARDTARSLAAKGFTALAADLFGEGASAHSDEEASALMMPLFLDRQLLQQRACAAYDALQHCAMCPIRKIGAIGFCFGGLTVIELIRSGVPLMGGASFHGLLGDTLDGQRARLATPKKMSASLLLLHGYEDPLVSEEDIRYIQKEMNNAGVDWQMHTYGHTAHAFTNPLASDAAHGLSYHPSSAARAWRAMDDFFNELLSK